MPRAALTGTIPQRGFIFRAESLPFISADIKRCLGAEAGIDGMLNKRAKLSCVYGVVPLLALCPFHPTHTFRAGRVRGARKFKKCNIFTQPNRATCAFP